MVEAIQAEVESGPAAAFLERELGRAAIQLRNTLN
jgi:hypothetical protein